MSNQPVISSPIEVLVAFLPMETRLIRRTGIELWTLFYWHDDLWDLVSDGKLHYIYYDPRDITVVYVRGKDHIIRRVPCITPNVKRMSLNEWRRICRLKRKRIYDTHDADMRDIGLDKMEAQVKRSISMTKAARKAAHKKLSKEQERRCAVDLLNKLSPRAMGDSQQAPELDPSLPITKLDIEVLN